MESHRSAYLALTELTARWDLVGAAPADTVAAPPPLTGFELRAFSQNGEDGVLSEIFRRIGVGGGGFVEFGVETGAEGNCVFLADVLGWPGLFMEGDADFCHHLQAKYRWTPEVRTRFAMVTPSNIEELFAAGGVPTEPDVLSIDIDGQDVWVWRAIHSHRPRVVVIEYNATLDPASRQAEPEGMEGGWQRTDFYGASLGALIAVGAEHGYRLVHTEITGNNAFFVREQDAGHFAPIDRVRGPNYFLLGMVHPPDESGRTYVDLDI